MGRQDTHAAGPSCWGDAPADAFGSAFPATSKRYAVGGEGCFFSGPEHGVGAADAAEGCSYSAAAHGDGADDGDGDAAAGVDAAAGASAPPDGTAAGADVEQEEWRRRQEVSGLVGVGALVQSGLVALTTERQPTVGVVMVCLSVEFDLASLTLASFWSSSAWPFVFGRCLRPS